MIDYIIEHHAKILGGFGTLCAFLGVTRPKARAFVVESTKLWKIRRKRDLGYEDTSEQLTMLTTAIVSIKGSVGAIEETSNRIEREVSLLTSHEELRFRNENYPSFVCNELAHNVAISDAYLYLVKARRAEDLLNGDWAQYIDPEKTDEYLANFKRQSENQADFSFSIEFFDITGRSRGVWRIRGSRVTDGLYKCKLTPEDEKSKELANENLWDLK